MTFYLESINDITITYVKSVGFPGGASSKEPACQCRRQRRQGFGPRFGKIPWRREWHPTPVFLPGESPWAEEPGGLQSMGSLGVGHDWATSFSLFTFMHWRRKWQPTPVFLPGESQGWGSLVGCRLWGRTESDTTEATSQQQQQQQGTREKPYYINWNIKWHYGEYDSICIPEMKSTYKLLL